MADPHSGRLIAPIVSWDHEAEHSIVLCACGGQMVFETGGEVSKGRAHEQWCWWRCLEDGGHVSRALPFPVQMTRG